MAANGGHPPTGELTDQNGVLVHLLHMLVSLYAYNEVVLQQYYVHKPVFFFAHPWFILGIIVDLLGIIRYSSDKFNLAKFQMMNVASLFYCTVGVPFLAAHYHLINGMPTKVAYAHLFLAILPFVLFRRRKYGPLYEVTRYTIIIACLSGLFGALVNFHVLAFVAFFLIMYAIERVGTGPEVRQNLSMYHWFVLYLCAVNVCLALSQSPTNNIVEIVPEPIGDMMRYVRYHVLKTPPVALFRGMMGRGDYNTKELKNLFDDLQDAGYNMEEVKRRDRRGDGFEDYDDEFIGGKGKRGKRGKGGKGKGKGKGAEPVKQQAGKGKFGKGVSGKQAGKMTGGKAEGSSGKKKSALSFLFG